ncbi:MAG TPA: ATP-binding protein [Oligoflexus sp.]|uniref:ATP-binding protein n=1 Tax=Oligoflexus sp. TaxID=1971216 RepID=UPI002D4F1EB9|nr:ATP-binding protein [Oligoflexus sp.]HYX38650.1 ATP-binding protein [Oligoflexus sp.]
MAYHGASYYIFFATDPKLALEEISFDLKELLADVMDLFREKVREKGLELQLSFLENIPSRLLSDPSRLRQILINLIGNAIKFTEKGGIEVKVEGHESSDSTFHVKIQVIDTGVGISAEAMGQLFQPFSQADNTHTRRYGGTGLGLALSQRLAAALNGKVEITESQVGQGSTFAFTFNANLDDKDKKLGSSAGSGKNSEKSLLTGTRILFADDSSDNALLAERILTKRGATVVIATNGVEAVELAGSRDFDLILLDIQMPYMDGYQALRLLRLEGYKRPIIAVTAHAMSHEIKQTLDAGFDANITKPLDQSVLINTLEVWLSKNGIRRRVLSS